MNTTHSIESQSSDIIKPGAIGRVLRMLLGGFLLWYGIRFSWLWLAAIQEGDVGINQFFYTQVVQKGNIALYLLFVIAVFFSPFYTRKLRLVMAAIIVAVFAAFDYLLIGDWWGLPFALLLSLIITAFLVFIGMANILAGIIANPG